MQQIRLDQYTITAYTPGASLAKQLLWFYIGSPLVQTSLLPFSGMHPEALPR
jgi:putative colanic acid biosynthesis acetyltransferase WcaF